MLSVGREFLEYYLDVLKAVSDVEQREVYGVTLYIDKITFSYDGGAADATIEVGENADLELFIGDPSAEH